MARTMIDTETCSWCTDEVPERELLTIQGGDGARVCRRCQASAVSAANGELVGFAR